MPALSSHFSPVSGCSEAGHPESAFGTVSDIPARIEHGSGFGGGPRPLEGEADQNPKLRVVTTESASLLCVTEVPGTGPAGLTSGPVTSFSNAR